MESQATERPLEICTDERLMELYQADDRRAFTILHDRLHAPLLHHISNVLNRYAPSLIDHAPDILQDVWAWIHNYRGRFISGTMVRSWFFTTAERLTRNRLKFESRLRRDKRRQRPLEPNYNPYNSEERGDSDEEVARKNLLCRTPNNLAGECEAPIDRLILEESSQRCLNTLPKHLQDVVRLRYFEGLQPREIAARLDISRSTVVRWLQESLKIMREAEVA